MENGEVKLEILLLTIMIIGGIIGINSKKSKFKIIIVGCFYIIGSIIGFINAKTYPDLIIWAVLFLIYGIVSIISFMKKYKK